MCIMSHAPKRNRQKTTITGHLGTVGTRYEPWFLSPFWSLQLKKRSTFVPLCFSSKWRNKAIPLQPWTRPLGSEILENRQMKAVRLSQPYAPAAFTHSDVSGTHFYQRLSWSQGHTAAGRITPMQNQNDHNGNRTRDLLDSNAVLQPTESSRT